MKETAESRSSNFGDQKKKKKNLFLEEQCCGQTTFKAKEMWPLTSWILHRCENSRRGLWASGVVLLVRLQANSGGCSSPGPPHKIPVKQTRLLRSSPDEPARLCSSLLLIPERIGTFHLPSLPTAELRGSSSSVCRGTGCEPQAWVPDLEQNKSKVLW